MKSTNLVCGWTLWAFLAGWPLVPQAVGQAPDTSSPVRHAKALSQAFRQAAERASPSVVTVIVRVPAPRDAQSLRELFDDPRFRGLFPYEMQPDELGDEEPADSLPGDMHVGSGLVVDSAGVVLTNHHVVANADEVTIRFGDGQEVVAEGVVSDAMSDLAIVKINPIAGLTAAQFGNSDELSIGDWVIAIGSPFELEATVSAGIISATGRGIDKIKRGRLFQTDAAINPGNSGGPLVNLDGEVVAINTAIATSNGGYQGVGFAIPGNRANWIWKELRDYGRVRRAYLGIGIDELNAADAPRFSTTARSGVWVRSVFPDGAAAAAGIQVNDVILEFGGAPVRMPRDLQDIVEQSPTGSKLPVTIRRDGQVITLDVVLQPAKDL
jgi:serine protease Do